MLGGLLGIICCGELLTRISGAKLLRWIAGLSAMIFFLFIVSLEFESHHALELVVIGFFGLVTAPIFMLAYEQGAEMTRG